MGRLLLRGSAGQPPIPHRPFAVVVHQQYIAATGVLQLSLLERIHSYYHVAHPAYFSRSSVRIIQCINSGIETRTTIDINCAGCITNNNDLVVMTS